MNFQLLIPIVGIWIILGIFNHIVAREMGGAKYDTKFVIFAFILFAPFITAWSVYKAFINEN